MKKLLIYSNVSKCRQALTWDECFSHGLFIRNISSGILAHEPQFQVLLPNSEQLASDWSGQMSFLIYASILAIAVSFFTQTSFPCLKIETSPLLHPSLLLHFSAFISRVGKCVFNIFGYKPESTLPLKA